MSKSSFSGTSLERLSRRSQVYRGRLRRSLGGHGLKHPCAFMHVPKCGGTSLADGLYALVPLQRKIGILDSKSIRLSQGLFHQPDGRSEPLHDEGPHAALLADFREQLLLMHMAHGCQLIHGHFLFSQKAWKSFGEAYRFVTILRDPIARTVSNYRMALRNRNFEGPLETFVQSDIGRRMALHNLRYFTGCADPEAGQLPMLVDLAKKNMRHFAVIGFIDRQDEFVERFEKVFGVRPSIGHYNRATSEAIEISDRDRRALEKLCEPDLELDAFARGLGR